MSKVYYIPDFHVEDVGFNALNKSREDLHKIYQQLGFQPLFDSVLVVKDEKLRYFKKNSSLLSPFVDEVIEKINSLNGDNYIFMDFPFSIKFPWFSKIITYAARAKIKLIFFIHDLDGIRFQNPLLNMTDSMLLDMAYSLISATPNMNKVILDSLKVSKKVKIVNYNYWDYLTDNVNNENRQALICFAGNLAKSSFLNEVPLPLINAGFNMYGKGYDKSYGGQYIGEYDPETLVKVLDGKYGLVWDGKSSKTCTGNFGKYLRINCSHKFALYIASSKPVLVWNESPVSKIVKEKNIGFSFSSLYEIPYILQNVNEKQYEEMLRNVKTLKNEIIDGSHLKKVILEAMK